MPFIVVATYSPRLLFKPVVITEVDPFLLVSCQNIITLIAVVEGDLAGHSYFWEQTGGPTVTWLEPQNQLEVMFQKSTSDDLFFRFWMDKDTPHEQYRDTLVAGVARDDVPPAVVSSTLGNISIYNESMMAGITNVTIIPGLSVVGEVTVNNVNKTLVWTNPTPTYPVLYTSTEIYKIDNGSQLLIESFNTPISSFQIQNSNQINYVDNYIFRSYWDLYGAKQFTGFIDVAKNFSSVLLMDTSDNVDSTNVSSLTYGDIKEFQLALLSLSQFVVFDEINGNNSKIESSGDIYVNSTQILSLSTITNIQDTFMSAINKEIAGDITIYQTQVSGSITTI